MPRKHSRKSPVFSSGLGIVLAAILFIVLALAAFVYFQDGATPPQQSPAGVSAAVTAPSPQPDKTPKADKTPAPSGQRPGLIDGMFALYALDIGQADALILISPGGKVMMIDAGESDAFPTIDAFLKEMNIRRIDVLVATHPHADHIGSMPKVIENYDIGHIYMSHAVHTTSLFSKLLDAIEKKKVPLTQVSSGMHIEWDTEIAVDVLAPQQKEYKNLNNYSVVLKLTYGQTSFLLAGDAEKLSEKEMLEQYASGELDADVLKAGHHGSDTSSTKAFVQAVTPNIVIFTVSADDDGLHPDPKVIKRFEATGSEMLRTSKGRVMIVSDGVTAHVSQAS